MPRAGTVQLNGLKIAQERHNQKLTQPQLAARAVVSPDLIRQVEQGGHWTLKSKAIKIVAALTGEERPDLGSWLVTSPDSFDVVVPVGPMPSDVDAMRGGDLSGIKLTAMVRGKSILEHIIAGLMHVHTKIRTVRLLMIEPGCSAKVQGTQDWLRSLALPFTVKVVPGCEDTKTPLQTLCTLHDLTARFILQYQDVWATETSFYEHLIMRSLQPAPDDCIYGGTLACATRLPTNFETTLTDVTDSDLSVDGGVFAKAYHAVRVKTSGGSSFRLANMAICVLTSDLLNAIRDVPMFQETELFTLISGRHFAKFHFHAHLYDGEWYHCHTTQDANEMNTP